MACQSNPKTYAIVIRCPLEDGAAIKALAESEGSAVSAYVAKMIHDKVKGRALGDAERAWVAEHLELNLARRARADAKAAAGYYKRKRRGRPRKPGPKGTKRKVRK